MSIKIAGLPDESRWLRWEACDGYGNLQPGAHFVKCVDAADDGPEVDIISFFKAAPNGRRGVPEDGWHFPMSLWRAVCALRRS